MRILVTGASGFIGSAVVAELLRAGHQVLGLVRSDASASAVRAAGAEVLRGSLEQPESFATAAANADGIVHTAFDHDFSKSHQERAAKDVQVIQAMGTALKGSQKPLVIASGMVGLAHGRAALETDLVTAQTSFRGRAEELQLELAELGVRSAIVRLPPTVHGAGDHGFVPYLISIARSHGVSAYIGDGNNRWPAVHRFDAARLFRLAVEKALPGSRLHAVQDEGVLTRDIANVIGRRLGVPVISKSREEAPAHFGFLAPFFGMDVLASSALTRQSLGWSPTEQGLLADLDAAHYFEQIPS